MTSAIDSSFIGAGNVDKVPFKEALDTAASEITALQDGKLDVSATTTFTRTLLDDATAADARATLGVPAIAVNGGTDVGAFSLQAPGAGAALVLPSGGVWSYFAFYLNGSGQVTNAVGGVAAGGTTVGGALAGFSWVGFIRRES